MGEPGSSHGPILPPSDMQCLVCPYPGASKLAMVELGEVLIWYRMLIQGGPSIFLQGRTRPCQSGEAAAALGLPPHQ